VAQTTQAMPNFFIAGAPKAGTTSLYHYLDQHPHIYMSPIKEPCYFASELRPENVGEELQEQVRTSMRELRNYLDGPMTSKRFGGFVTEWTDYLRLFQNVRQETAIGEASVCYLWSRTAARHIVSRIPEGKIILMLRDPADRAFSQYLHVLSQGAVRVSFREYFELSLHSESKQFGNVYPFLEYGQYYEQVKRYQQVFPEKNIRIYFYEDYRRDPMTILRQIFRFLSVDATFSPDMSQRHLEPRVPRFITASYWMKKLGLWRRVKDWTPVALHGSLRMAAFRQRSVLQLDAEDRARLVDYYRDDISKLACLVGRDLSEWLTP
jgi:hypothetical protein